MGGLVCLSGHLVVGYSDSATDTPVEGAAYL